MRCLRKDPERRPQHMVDVKLALEELKEDSESDAGQPPWFRRDLRAAVLWIAAAAAILAMV